VGKARELAQRYGAGLQTVVFLGPDGRFLGRYEPEKLYDAGDPERLLKEMRAAHEERKRVDAGGIPPPLEGGERLGKPLPAWEPDGWLQGRRESLASLRGKVVLVRFFTDTCPFCDASMPALAALHERHRAAGLETLGFYHPKPRGAARDAEGVRRLLASWEVAFPVALDTRWKTLEAWWLQGAPRRATSVTFLLDRKGAVRFLHPGPELHPGEEGCNLVPEDCNRSFADLEAAVEKLLAEDA